LKRKIRVVCARYNILNKITSKKRFYKYLSINNMANSNNGTYFRLYEFIIAIG